MRSGFRAYRYILILACFSVVFALLSIFGPIGSSQAGHKPYDIPCGRCHTVSGATDKVVLGTNLIKEDGRLTEIQGDGIWAPGEPLPCIYCHEDSTGNRTVMAGVKDQFGGGSLSKHDVRYLSSNADNDPSLFDCVDCHTNVEYVGQGVMGDPLNPNIHSVNAQLDTIGATNTQLPVSTTLIASPYNSDNNPLCASQCHLADPGTLGIVPPLAHAISTTLVSLEAQIGGPSAGSIVPVQGCLNGPDGTVGCHGIHDSPTNTGLITVKKGDGTDVQSADCGFCHTFDDPISGNITADPGRTTSEYYGNGHGYISTITSCTTCHDETQPHFNVDGTSTGNRLIFAEDPDLSTFSNPPFSLRSVCNDCHLANTYKPHSAISEGGQVSIGCLDCHDPHGRMVEDASGKNIFMLRRAAPKPGAANTIYYETAGAYFDSSTWDGTPDNFSNQLCDSADCHGIAGGPGALSEVMSPSNGSHSGGTTGITDCTSCHKHEDNAGAMRATESCSTCHGDTGNGTTWPDDPTNILAVRPDREGAHPPHVSVLGGNTACATCHPGGKHSGDQDNDPADLHQDGVGGDTTWFQTMPYIGGSDLSATYSTTPSTCGSVSCHGGNDTPSWYGVTPPVCLDCHGSNTAEGGGLGDGIPNAVNDTVNDEWYNDGHGSPSGGSLSSALGGCDYCHQLDADHFPTDAANPYRLRFSATDNTLCLQCHESGSDPGIIQNSASQALTSVTSVKDVGTTHYGTKHSGDEGGRFCWDCHDPHGVPDNILMVKGNVSQSSNTWGVPGATVTVSGFASTNNVSSFVDTSTSDPREGLCQACHDPGKGDPTTPAGSTKYWLNDGNDDPTGSNSLSSSHNITKVCTTCHEHQTGFAGVGDACNACHDNPPLTGAHQLHATVTTNDQSEDRSDCAWCHTGANLYTFDPTSDQADTTTPLNHSDPTGRVGVLRNAVGYSGTDKDCSNSCHVSDITLPGGPDGAWNDTNSLNCDACHYYEDVPVSANNTGSRALTETHNAHFDASNANIVCADCHAVPVDTTHIDNFDAVADSDGAVLYDKADAEMDEATVLTSTLGLGGADTDTPVPGWTSCDNGQCHNPSAASYAATWGNTNATCTFCHGDNDVVGGTNVATGSHPVHFDYAGTGYAPCTVCHVDNDAIYGHMDRAVSMTAALVSYSGNTADYAPSTYGSCDTGGCHNSDTDPIWGTDGITDCTVCHLANAPDVNSFSGTDRQASLINNAEFTGADPFVGHGTTGIDQTCTDCHSASISHDSTPLLNGSNPYRLDTSGGGFSCSANGAGCHIGKTGSQTGLLLDDMVTHSAPAMSAAAYVTKYTWSFAPDCVNCHDPHGDNNLSMIQREMYDKETFDLMAAPPTAAIDNTSLVFDNNVAGLTSIQESYADYNDGYSSICQECHEGTAGVDTPKGFNDDTSANFSGHPGYDIGQPGNGNPGDCSDCHEHDTAFKPSGCSGCHGRGTPGTDSANYWPDSSTIKEENTAGRHPIHMEQLAMAAYSETIGDLLTNSGTSSDEKQKTLCEYCHAALTNDGDHSSSLPAEVFDTSLGRKAKRIWDGAEDTDAAYSGTPNFTCAAVDCHSQKTTPAGYEWYGASSSACILCHTNVTVTGTPTGETHTAHADSTTFGRVVVCGDCHTGSTGTAPDWAGNIKPDPGHTDGTFLVSGGLVSFTYSGYTYPSVKGSCGTNACHNDGTDPVTGTPAMAYTWGTAVSPDCATCHNNPNDSGKHIVHIGNSAYVGDLCGACHVANTNNTSMNAQLTHIDGTVDTGGTSSVAYSTADENCTNNCHQANTPGYWTTTVSNALDCTDCHVGGTGYIADNAGAYLPTSGLHTVTPTVSGQMHAEALSPSSGCAVCHTGVLGEVTHIAGTFEGGIGETTEMGLDTFYTQTANDTGTCLTTGCHTTLSDAWEHNWDSTPGYYTSATGECAGCHGDFANGWNTGVDHKDTAATRTKHGTGTTYECQDCHTLEAAAANYTFTYGSDDWDADGGETSNHGNAVIEVNSQGSYDEGAPGYCQACHSASPYDITNTDWALDAAIVGDAISISCGECHSGGVTLSTESGAHVAHTASRNDLTADSGADCAVCHGAAAAGYTSNIGDDVDHGDDTVTFSVTYSQAGTRGDTTGTCSDAGCHYSRTTPVWNTTGTTCTTCHYDGVTDDGSVGNAWPATDKTGAARGDAHETHIDNTSYVTTGTTNCTDCHADNTGTHSDRFDDTLEPFSLSAEVTTYDPGTGTCTNTCHDGSVADFTDAVPTVTCTDCHAGTYIGGGSNMPDTGLHVENLTYPDVEAHDYTFGDSDQYSCTDCHDSTGPSDGHITGVKQSPAGTTFNWNLTGKTININVAANTTDNTCTATCHADNNNWQRQWSKAAFSSATTVGDTRCDVCHGQLSNWRGGLSVNHDKAKVNDGTHSDCTVCHVYPDSPYDWVTDHDTTPTHEVQYNSNTDLNYNATDGTCNSACHDAAKVMGASTIFPESGLVGVGASCSTCHNYVNDADHSEDEFTKASNPATGWATTPTRSTGNWNTHQEHINTGLVECIDCHGHQGSTIEHNEGRDATASTTVDPAFVNVQVSQAFSLRGAATYLGDPTTPGDPKRCDNISCHYGLTPDWGMRNFAAPAGTVTPSAGPVITGTTIDDDTTHNVINALTFTHVGGDVTVSNFRISETGTAVPTTDITQIQLWVSADNVWDGGDTLIGTGVWKGAYFEPASLINHTVSATINVLVTADVPLNATDSATVQLSLDLLQASFGNIDTANMPISSDVFTINNAGVITPSDGPVVTGGAVAGDTTQNVIDALTFAHTGGTAVTISGFEVVETGSAVPTGDLTQVQLWESADNVWDGGDTLIGTGTWSTDRFTATGLSYNVTGTINVLVTADVPLTATDAGTIILQLQSLSASAGTIDTVSMPTTSQIFTINNPGVVTPSNGPVVTGGSVDDNTTLNVIDALTFTYSGGGTVTLSGFEVVETGTAVPTGDLSQVQLWESVDNVWDGGDTLIGTGAWSTDRFTATGLSYGVTSTINVLVTADVPLNATDNSTIVLQLQSLTASAGSVDTASMSTTSNSFDINNPPVTGTIYYIVDDASSNLGADGTATVSTGQNTGAYPEKTTFDTTNGSVDTSVWRDMPGGATDDPLARVYLPINYATNTEIDPNPAIQVYVSCENIGQVTVKADLGEYDPGGAADNFTLIGSTGYQTLTNTAATLYNWNITSSAYTVSAGNRLQLRFYGTNSFAPQPRQVEVHFNSSTYESYLNVTETTATPGTVTPSDGPVISGGAVDDNTTQNVVDVLTFTYAGGSPATLSGFEVFETGTAVPTGDLIQVQLWEDGGTPNVRDGANDTLIGTGTWSTDRFTATGLSYDVSGTINVLLTADVPLDATDANTIVLQLQALTASVGSIDTANMPTTSQTFTINNPGIVTPSDGPVVSGGSIDDNTTLNVVDALTFTHSGGGTGTVTLSGFEVVETGSAVPTGDLTQIQLWESADNIWDGGDTLIGTATWNAGNSRFDVTGLSYDVTGTINVLITADVPFDATDTNTIVLRLQALTASTGTIDTGSMPTTSASFAINNPPAGGTVTPSDGPVISGGSVDDDTTNNEIDALTFTYSGSGTVTLSGFEVFETGTAVPTGDLTQVQLWESADNVWDGGDTLIGTGTWSTDRFTATGLSYNVTSTINVLVTADVPLDATDANTIVLQLQALTASAGAIDTGSMPTTSASFTINNPAAGVLLSNGTFDTDIISWTATINIADGSHSWDGATGNTDNSQGQASGNGSLNIQNTSASRDQYAGYLEANLSAPITTSPADYHFAWRSSVTNPADAQSFDLDLEFLTSANVSVGTVAINSSVVTQAWTAVAGNVALSGQADKVRINFDLRNVNKGAFAGNYWVDDIGVAASSGPLFASPTQTSGDQGTACNTCHQFGPLDDDDYTGASPGSNSIPDVDEATSPRYNAEYSYPNPGDHDKHGVADLAILNPVNTDTTGVCDQCHVDASAYPNNHMNGVKDLDSGSIGYGAGTGSWTGSTCTTVNCHNGAETPVWGVGSATCTTCHALPPDTNAHTPHFTAKGWSTGVTTNCTVCHPDNEAGGHSSIDGTPEVGGTKGISYTTPNCTAGIGGVGCHASAPTNPDWTGGAIVCTDCHVPQTVSNGYDPFSGLHTTDPAKMISGNPHDGTFAETAGGGDTGSCDTCHTTVPSATHQDSTLDTPSTWAAGVNFTPGTTSCDANCHLDTVSNRTGTAVTQGWERQWSVTADDDASSPDARCQNCHGTFWAGQSYNTGVEHYNTGNMLTMHATGSDDATECDVCHAFADAAYNSAYVTGDHGNASITINDNPGGTISGWSRGSGADSNRSV